MTLSKRMLKHISALAVIGSDHVGIEVYCETADEVINLEATNAALLDVVRDCVNFLADLDTKSDRAKALHKRAYTAHSKAKGE